MATLHVDVVSAEELIFSGEAKFVALPGENGELGIMPRHMPAACRRPVLIPVEHSRAYRFPAAEIRFDAQGRRARRCNSPTPPSPHRHNRFRGLP